MGEHELNLWEKLKIKFIAEIDVKDEIAIINSKMIDAWINSEKGHVDIRVMAKHFAIETNCRIKSFHSDVNTGVNSVIFEKK